MRPQQVKELVEHRPTLTGAQAVQLMVVMKKSNGSSKGLEISHHPQTIALKHRSRSTSVISAANVSEMIVTARSVLCEEIDSRFIDTCFSDARLIIQIYISNGADPSKILSTDNLISAKALYRCT